THSFHSPCMSFFFHDTPPPDIPTLSLHDALPIWSALTAGSGPISTLPFVSAILASKSLTTSRATISRFTDTTGCSRIGKPRDCGDRKSTRLNSSHSQISYAVFCLKKKHLIST